MDLSDSLSKDPPFVVQTEQKVFLEEKVAQAIRSQPLWASLSAKLLALGGTHIAAVYEEDIESIMQRGEAFAAEGAIRRPGAPISCHANAARLWEKNPKRYSICTGWALSQDGIWRQHSWGYDHTKSVPVETTLPRTLYFGYKLGEDEAEEFSFENQ